MAKSLILLILLVLIFCVLALIFPIKVSGEDKVVRLVDLLNVPAVRAEESRSQLPADVLVILNGTVIDGAGRAPRQYRARVRWDFFCS